MTFISRAGGFRLLPQERDDLVDCPMFLQKMVHFLVAEADLVLALKRQLVDKRLDVHLAKGERPDSACGDLECLVVDLVPEEELNEERLNDVSFDRMRCFVAWEFHYQPPSVLMVCACIDGTCCMWCCQSRTPPRTNLSARVLV